MHRAGVIHVRACERAPSDQLVLLLVINFGVPLDRHARRSFHDPVRALRIIYAHLFDVTHEARQVLEVAPEAEQLCGRAVDRQALLDLDAAPGAHAHVRIHLVRRVEADGLIEIAMTCDAAIE